MKIKSFTLIELIIVIAIIAIAAGAMTPLFSGKIAKYRLDADVQELFSDIKQAQQFSLSRENQYSYYGIRFYNNLGQNNDQQGYKILRYEPLQTVMPISDPPGVAPTVVKSGQATDNPLIVEQGAIFHGSVEISAISEIIIGDRLIFTPQGSVTTDGQVYLSTAKDNIILECRNYSQVINIYPRSGNIEIN